MKGSDVPISVIDGNIDCTIFENKRVQVLFDNTSSCSKHGTAVVGQILKECPSAEILLINILDEHNKCSVTEFVFALSKAISLNNKVINISLGFTGCKDKSIIKNIKDLCLKAQEEDIVIFAAHHNNESVPSYPECIKETISIKMVYSEQFVFCPDFDKREIIVSRNLAGLHHMGSYETYRGTSYVCPIITGLYSEFIKRNQYKPGRSSLRSFFVFMKILNDQYGHKIFYQIDNNLLATKKICYIRINQNQKEKERIDNINKIAPYVLVLDIFTFLEESKKRRFIGWVVIIGECVKNDNIDWSSIRKQLIDIIKYGGIVITYPAIFSIYERFILSQKYGKPIFSLL